jgi:hypothetical protein
MTEKRYKSHKYVRCYCTKDEEILVGAKLYRFVNIFFMIPGCMFIGWFAIMAKSILLGCLVLLSVIMCRVDYVQARKTMLQHGHTEDCSRKIAYLAVLYSGTWSEFKIMKNKENLNGTTSTLKKP